jgi:hypothetical protein
LLHLRKKKTNKKRKIFERKVNFHVKFWQEMKKFLVVSREELKLTFSEFDDEVSRKWVSSNYRDLRAAKF